MEVGCGGAPWGAVGWGMVGGWCMPPSASCAMPCTACQVDSTMVAIAVEWTPARLRLLDDVTDLVDAIASRPMRKRIQIIPVANWGITTALNACLHEAARLQTKFVAFQSLEIGTTPEIVAYLRSTVGQDTLVAGVALTGHQFDAGDHTLTGTNCPWNTLAVWRVEKLAMTGFVAIGNGSLPGASAGVEEVSTITVIQQLRTAVGRNDAQAKLLRIPGVGWDTEWADEGRRASHAKKMASKQERAAQHLEMLQLQTALVCHIDAAETFSAKVSTKLFEAPSKVHSPTSERRRPSVLLNSPAYLG